jgi:hypothetical protein
MKFVYVIINPRIANENPAMLCFKLGSFGRILMRAKNEQYKAAQVTNFCFSRIPTIINKISKPSERVNPTAE